MIVAQASPDEVLDQLAADPFVLRRRFDEAQGDLLAVHRDPQSDHVRRQPFFLVSDISYEEIGRLVTAIGVWSITPPRQDVFYDVLRGDSEMVQRLATEMYARGLSTRDIEDACAEGETAPPI